MRESCLLLNKLVVQLNLTAEDATCIVSLVLAIH